MISTMSTEGTAAAVELHDTEATPGACDPNEEAIPVLRGQIDSLDEAIKRLVAERVKLSARVQTARVNAGGARVQLGRERVIRESYRSALGIHGPALADAILLVSRGAK